MAAASVKAQMVAIGSMKSNQNPVNFNLRFIGSFLCLCWLKIQANNRLFGISIRLKIIITSACS